MYPRTFLPVLLACSLAACVENEEELTIRPDGSVSVRMSAKSKQETDLADGFPLPFDAAWSPANAATREWIASARSHTPSPTDREEALELAVDASFASVRDLPRFTAPESEPYRGAYLERTSDLRVETRGGKRVYTFERVYHGRDFARFDVWTNVERDLPKDLYERLDGDGPLSAAERDQIVVATSARMVHGAMAFADDALLSLYTQGDASLSAASNARVHVAVERAVASTATEPRVRALLDALRPVDGADEDDEKGAAELTALERDVRATLRDALARALTAEGVSVAARNGVRGELEARLTAYDHTVDLSDEGFKLVVHMPGTIVGGNFDERASDDTATFELDGEDLRDRDRVLRVVSVVE